MAVRICETVTARSMAELRRRRDAAVRADLVELRLDGVGDVDVAGALAGRRKPVVVTCRPAWDGGRFDGSEQTRLSLLADALARGAEFVDVEYAADWHRLAHVDRARLILSFHDWHGAPPDLADRVRLMRQAGTGLIKVAVMARRLADCLVLRRATASGDGMVAVAMGERGHLSRVCPWLFNSCWTYAGSAAPGQESTDLLVDRYRVRAGSCRTAVYAVAGRPLRHSASPAMHNAGFAATGLDAVYARLEADSAVEVDEVATSCDVAGLSVTAPFKRELLGRAPLSDARTRALGAANTLRRTPDGWEAANFDADAFLEPLDRRGEAVSGRRAVVLGAGGAARAVVLALRDRGARVSVAARRADEARRLATELAVDTTRWPPRQAWDLIVNATPVGTWPDAEVVPVAPTPGPGVICYDLVYNPPDTSWLRQARRAGAATIGGLEMLVGQACRQFEWWTGRPAPQHVMADAALRFVTEESRESHAADDV